MVKNYLKLVALAAICGVNAQAQQLQNPTFDGEWVDCHPWEKGDYNKDAFGTQPEGWCVSNVPNSMMPLVAEEIEGADGTGKAVKLSNVSVMGQVAPGYITLGTTWATAETKGLSVQNADGGVFGGIPFTFHPDAIQMDYKHNTKGGEEQMSVIAYLWKGTWTQEDVPSNTAIGLFSWGTATPVTMTDRGNNVLGKDCLLGGAITQTEDAALIASVETYIPEATEEWTTLTAELNYGEYAGKIVDVEKFNIVVSVSDFFGDREKIVDGNSVCIDNVKLIYYHELSALAYEDLLLDVTDGTTAFSLDSVVYDAEKLSFNVKGQGAKTITTYYEENFLLTIRVEGEDIESNPESFTEYTIQFADPESLKPDPDPEPKPLVGDIDEDGAITVSDITLLIEIYLNQGAE